MSAPKRSLLEPEEIPKAQDISPDMSEPEGAVALQQPSAEDIAFDPGLHFDKWFEAIQTSPQQLASESPEAREEDSEIYIGSFPGSNCEVTFEGVLRFDGYSIGNIRSPEGTLVLTKRGRIEADIDVGVAVINGSVTGNIKANKRVVLDSDARVTGQINTRLLSVRLGAVFDGDCSFVSTAESVVEVSPKKKNHRRHLGFW